jgi:hypothetical protein
MFVFLAGAYLAAPTRETFTAPILNKDKVNRRHLWENEEIMTETPEIIQDLTRGPGLLKDEVAADAHKWEVENTLEEHPVGIQERPVADLPDYAESQQPHRS